MPPVDAPAPQTRTITPRKPSIMTTMGPDVFPRDKEVLDYTFFDSALIVTATADTYNLFASAGNNPLTSNWIGTSAGMPAGSAFYLKSIRVTWLPGTGALDAKNLQQFVSLLFTVDSSKKYFEAPIWNFPGGVGLQTETFATAATGTSVGNNGFPSLTNRYMLSRPVLLQSQLNFQVQLKANASVTLTASTRVFVLLDGLWMRAVR